MMGRKLRSMVMKRKERCDAVLGALKIQGPEIGGRLGEYLSAVLEEGEAPPDVGTQLQLYGRKLRGYCDAMVSADETHLTELGGLDAVRLEIDQPMRVLKQSILSLRATVQGLFGEGKVRSLNLDFNLAQDPKGVLRQAEIIRERLASDDLELTLERWIDGSVDRAGMLEELDRPIEVLRQTLARFLEQRKRVDTAKVRKDQAIKAVDMHFIPIAHVVEATFRVAGETELADRIRPTIRQLTRGTGDVEEAEPVSAAVIGPILVDTSPAAEPQSAVSA